MVPVVVSPSRFRNSFKVFDFARPVAFLAGHPVMFDPERLRQGRPEVLIAESVAYPSASLGFGYAEAGSAGLSLSDVYWRSTLTEQRFVLRPVFWVTDAPPYAVERLCGLVVNRLLADSQSAGGRAL